MLRIFRHYMSVSAVCLFACESAVMVFALLAAIRLLAPAPSFYTPNGVSIAVILMPIVIATVLLYAFGLYDRATIENVGRALPRLAAFCVIWAPAVAVAVELADVTVPHADPALVCGLSATLGFCGVLVARLCYLTVARATIAPHRALVLGVGKLAAELEYLNSARHHSECQVIGYVAPTPQSPEVPQSRTLPIDTSLVDLARERGAKEIVVALDERRGVSLDPLLEARMSGIRITSYLSFWEREARRVNLTALDPSWLIYSDGFRIGTATSAVLKRLLDILASLALLLFTLPTLILAAIAIHFSSPGPIFYRQERVGRNGATFTIYKFRTMRIDAEGNGVPQWASHGDPRVTTIGRILRTTRLDELPQIWNVLRGDMSFVGPRPERPFFVNMLGAEIPFYRERHRVRPGLTGWAQINYPYGASIEDARAKLSYDLYYVKNYSLLFDFLIILSTAHAVLFRKGGR